MSDIVEIIVDEEFSGERIDNFVSMQFPEFSRSTKRAETISARLA